MPGADDAGSAVASRATSRRPTVTQVGGDEQQIGRAPRTSPRHLVPPSVQPSPTAVPASVGRERSFRTAGLDQCQRGDRGAARPDGEASACSDRRSPPHSSGSVAAYDGRSGSVTGGTAEFLRQDGQLEHSVAGAAARLRERDARPAQVDRLVPELARESVRAGFATRAADVGYVRSSNWRAESASSRWSSSRVRSTSGAPRQAEAALGDDVLLHLGAAGGDGDRDALEPLALHLAVEQAERVVVEQEALQDRAARGRPGPRAARPGCCGCGRSTPRSRGRRPRPGSRWRRS